MAATAMLGAAQAGTSILQGIGSLATGFSQAAIAKEQGKILAQRHMFNAKMARLRAEDILEQGDEAAANYMETAGRAITQFEAAQETGYAAQGVKVGSGAAGRRTGEAAARARNKAQRNIMRIKMTAQNQAQGLETVALNEQAAAGFAKRQSGIAARNAIAGGIGKFGMSLLQAGEQARDAGLLDEPAKEAKAERVDELGKKMFVFEDPSQPDWVSNTTLNDLWATPKSASSV